MAIDNDMNKPDFYRADSKPAPTSYGKPSDDLADLNATVQLMHAQMTEMLGLLKALYTAMTGHEYVHEA